MTSSLLRFQHCEQLPFPSLVALFTGDTGGIIESIGHMGASVKADRVVR